MVLNSVPLVISGVEASWRRLLDLPGLLIWRGASQPLRLPKRTQDTRARTRSSALLAGAADASEQPEGGGDLRGHLCRPAAARFQVRQLPPAAADLHRRSRLVFRRGDDAVHFFSPRFLPAHKGLVDRATGVVLVLLGVRLIAGAW